MREHRRVGLLLAGSFVCHLAGASLAAAQAWLPPKGEGWFSLSYSTGLARDHYLSDGELLDQGHIRTHAVLGDLGYSVTDRFGVKLSLPYITTQYFGVNPHLLPADDGTYHGTFTDFRLEARYNALKGPVVLTPFVAAILPSHGYEYFGHAVSGVNLKQFLVGAGFGRRLDPFLPQAYFQGRYSFAFVEKVLGISHNRSNLDLQLGYFFKPSIQFFALGMGQITHGGLPLNLTVAKATWTAAEFHHHLQLTRSDLLFVGGGVDFLVTGALDFSITYVATVAGRSDHTTDSQLTLGITLGFSPLQVLRKASR